MWTFQNIRLGSDTGKLVLGETGVQFKSSRTNRMLSVGVDEVGGAVEWIAIGKGATAAIRLRTKNNQSHTFRGFRSTDQPSIDQYARESLRQKLEEPSISVAGRTWGNLICLESNDCLIFQTDGENGDVSEVFTLPFESVSNAVLQGPTEFSIELAHDDTKPADLDQLYEVRFYIPNISDGGDSAPAKHLMEEIMARSKLDKSHGEAICKFDDVPVVTPRGRYEVELFLSSFRLQGKSNQFKILYSNISRLFYLPKPDGVHWSVIISLASPLRQGGTMYPHIIIQFDQDDCEVEVSLSEEELNSKYDGKLSQLMEGPKADVFAKTLSILSSCKITKPCKTFVAGNGAKAVRCSYKANEGYLFPLEKSFFFINKPATYIRHDEISVIEFGRYERGNTAAGRTFDLIIMLRNGTSVQFSNIPRAEFQPLFNLIREKELKTANIEEDPSAVAEVLEEDEDSADDDDFEASSESEPEEEYNSDVEDQGVTEQGEEEHSDDDKKKKIKRKRSEDDGETKKKGKKKKENPYPDSD